MKILVVKRDKIGDLVLATPLLRVLRAALPEARIELLASDYNAWLLRGNRDVDRVWTYRRSRVGSRVSVAGALQQAILMARLRLQRYDVAIAAGGEISPRAARRAAFAGARRTIAYAGEEGPFVSDPLSAPRSGHERDRMIGLLSPLGIRAPEAPPLPAHEPSRESLEQARSWLAARGLSPRGYIVMGLGARRPQRRPEPEQVIRWSRRVRAALGLQTLLMWTPGRGDNPVYPGDDDVAEPVLAADLPGLHPFRGDLQGAVALVWHARTSIFPDSGLMHLAAASPGGVLGLFAQTDTSPHPSQWGPLGVNVDYLEAPARVAELDDDRVLERLTRLASRPSGGD
jgi:ADP-heptose:LPS heptosyltransferase